MKPKVTRAEHVAACSQPRDLPAPTLPEVAFLGRSNVGKSSLLNRLAGRRQLARTSATPGKTRLIHFYELAVRDTEVRFVDLPGYGYAKVSRSERHGWQRLVEGYLEDRPPLRLAVLLQDLRRDVSEDETLLLEWLAERGVASLVALTKADKLKPMRRSARVRELAVGFGRTNSGLVVTSAEKGLGIDDLWRRIFEAVS
ncbi:MAG: ribosome biogenesis GTP-binding protein YihA/YsxC [Proteobacteria bacterium]|nr:ribosome biogenesis GTP-binding protein YihA/YsxC [Pseudomonadota bacterium]